MSATMAPDRNFQQALTDSAGRFAIHFAAGTGDYLVHVSASGFRFFRKRVQRVLSDTAIGIDIKLASEATRLTAVRVQAQRERPDRRGDPAADVGAAEWLPEGVFASVAPDEEGSLAAIGNAVPGATARPDGLSVLGLEGSQSSVALNGLAFGGSGLPRDADVQVHVTTSTYDPSRGGFSGVQTSVELSPGRAFVRRRAHLTADAPPLQGRSAVGDQPGQRFTSLNGSIGGSGELVQNKWYYNSALQVSRRGADVTSLFTAGEAALRALGVAPDSVARLMQLLKAAQLPVTSADVPGTAISQAMSFVTRLDHAPYKPGTSEPAAETWNVNVYGNVADDQAQAFSPSAAPTRGGRHRSVFAGGQLNYSRFFGDVLNDSRSALSIHSDNGTPYLRLPTGSVLISSSLPGGDDALSRLTFGGNGALDYSQRRWTWEAINETQWYAKRIPHRLKLTAGTRLDGYFQTTPEDLLGTFNYPSLDALAVGRPSSFSRTVSAPVRTGGEWSGFVALGDYWRMTPSLQLLFGARIEGNRFNTALAENAAIASVFDASTTHAPNTVHVSPRLGFSWYFGHEPGGSSVRYNAIARQTLWPAMMLRGGIGEFRGFLPPTLLADASDANGLPGGISRVTCIGAATPPPQWEDYVSSSGAIPTTCMNGAPSSFTDAAPSVHLFERSFDAPRSWRANLSWVRTIGSVGLMLDGVYSLNLNQPSMIDLNLAGAPKFTLADEDNRPVFVTPSAIVAATGELSPIEARVTPSFGRVVSSRSDVRSRSRQITATVTSQEFSRVYYSLSYTLADMRAESRGFDGATFGAPSFLERAPGDFDVRHQLAASIGASLPHKMNVALYGRVMSGLPYTPRIIGDVNGDGLANDRAFIFNPARAGDDVLASGMRSLLAAAPSQARACLSDQLGRPAQRNSCRGPWSASLNARIGLINRGGVTRRGFNAVLHITNLLGGLDQLLHGSEQLQGWGAGALPDPTLLVVRGFDPTSRRFRYEVNPRFGSTHATQQLARIPFRVTLDLNFDLGVPIVKQQAIKLLSPGRRGRAGPRMSPDSMATQLKRQVPDLYDAIIGESDSLLISRDQLEALRTAQAGYRARVDSLWKATTTILADMSDEYDADRAMYLIDDATERAWLIARDELPVLETILSPLQMRLAPWIVAALKQSLGKKKVGVRFFTF